MPATDGDMPSHAPDPFAAVSTAAVILAGLLAASSARAAAQPATPGTPEALREPSVHAAGAWSRKPSARAPELDSPGATGRAVRFFFIADVHSRHHIMERLIHEANRQRPDFVLEGGDFVHDGTASEFGRAYADRARLEPPWHVAKGNHDAERRGPFSAPPPRIPEFQAFDHGGVRFILLDNHTGTLTEAQFERLESELAARDGAPIVIAMHVPPILSREPFMMRLRHLVPFRLASPTMSDPAQVERFTRLMERYRVLAVLAAHTHYPDEHIRGGVHYIVAGTAGGLRPGLGIPREYLDIGIDGREVVIRRVVLEDPARNPITWVADAFRFFAHVNGFSHAEQGWNYIPSTSVQLKSGLALTEARQGENLAALATASFERVLGASGRRALFADAGLSAAPRELAAHLATGYKLRPVGDFNENVFVGGAATANAGMLRGAGTAGLGARLGLGFEWRTLTAELSRNWATNHRASSLGVGHRF